mgnify:CR=1 FL=1
MKAVIERSLALLMCAVCVGLPMLGVAQPPLSPMNAREIRIPLYRPGRSEPTALITIQRIYKDHQRRGFFRIGALPLWVADGVTVQLLTQEAEEELIATLTRALRTCSGGMHRSMEVRSFQVFLGKEAEPRLQAGRVIIGDDGTWHLSDPVQLKTASQTMRWDRARISASGPDSDTARELCMVVEGARRISLFDILRPSNAQPPPKTTPHSK